MSEFTELTEVCLFSNIPRVQSTVVHDVPVHLHEIYMSVMRYSVSLNAAYYITCVSSHVLSWKIQTNQQTGIAIPRATLIA